MTNILFYAIVIGLTSGILFRSFFDVRVPDILFLLFLSFTLALVWRFKARPYRSYLFVVSLLILSVGIGMVRLEYSEQVASPLRIHVGVTKTWEGVVVRELDERQTSTHLYMRETETGTLVLVTADPFTEVSYGDRISVTGTLTRPEAFETETGRIFDYAGYLKAKGVTEMISFGAVEVTGEGEGNPVLARLYTVKAALMESLEEALPEPAAGLGEGILLGVKRALGEELTEIFRVAGIVHIVVLSGYNIMIVADSVMRALGYVFYPRTRLMVGVSVIIFFALLVGLSATVVRASIMAILILLARHIGRQYAILRALCITGVIMLFINPYLLAFDPGFQLSFLATLGLILLAPWLEKQLSRVPNVLGVRGYLASTIGTQVYVLPILLFSMGTVSLVSVLVNILVLPVVPLAMFLTFITGVAGLVSSMLGYVVGFGAYVVLMYIIKIASFAAALPFAEILIPPVRGEFIALLFGFIGMGTYWLHRHRAGDEVVTENAYNDWTIETETESPPGDSAPSGDRDVLPFK